MTFLACDWGTTNLRAWVLDEDGKVLREREFPLLGVAQLGPGEAARRFREEVRPGLVADDLPAILCGMIGSTLGWAVADYVPCPADWQELSRNLLRADRGLAPVDIVPGMICEGQFRTFDVMRGEETQIFGWAGADPDRRLGRRLICHPGTHAKWVVLNEGRIERFITAMTGELFGLLRTHGVLRHEAAPDDEAAFDAGVAAAGDGGALASRLFSARARVVAGGEAAQSTPSYLSGLLIGAEVASVPDLLGCDGPVDLIGEPALMRWYARALDHRGRATTLSDGDAAARAGLAALYRRLAA